MLKREILDGVQTWLEEYPAQVGQALKVYKNAECTISQDCPDSGKSITLSVKPYFQQNWEGKKEKMEESIICAFLWQQILHETLLYRIQETPQCFTDKEIDSNDKLVKSYIECVPGFDICSAAFYGGTQGEDGYIEFKKPPLKRKRWFQLEIGYCHATQTQYHMIMNQGFARLPYGHDYIVYFENVRSMDLGL